MVAETGELSGLVVTVKLAVLLPAATVTDAGRVAETLSLDNDTEIPPVGATVLKVTVPVEDTPPLTLAGPTETEEMAAVPAGVMVSAAVLLTAL